MAEGRSRPVPIKVRSHAGYKAEEYPQAFSIGSRSFRVKKILDRWYGTDHAYFKIRADDENLYILRYNSAMNSWELVFMETGTRESR